MILDVPTSLGSGRLTVSAAADPRAVVWLGHGAGGGIGAVDLAALAAHLPALGITVARYEQPWRVAGKKVAPRPPTLDVAWRETAPAITELAAGLPIVVGGRSAGARVACRTADDLGAAAVVCLAFPLHPPGRPAVSRLEELLQPTVPVLVLQGEADFAVTAEQADEIVAVLRAAGNPSVRAHMLPGHTHSFTGMSFPSFAARPAPLGDDVLALIEDWLLSIRE